MIWRTTCEFLATGFYAGRLHPGPGTWGTAVGAVLYCLIFAYFPKAHQPAVSIILTLALCGLAVYISEQACQLKIYGDVEDAPQIVIDEIAGFFVTMFGLGVDLKSIAVGFLLFRLFDILKPWPIRQIQRIPGGWGIVLDDLLAGLFANVVIRLIV